MAVGDDPLPLLRPVPGVRLGAAEAGIRKPGRPDLVVLELAAGSEVAAAFTRNRFRAAPVRLAEHHLAVDEPRYLLINTGNANAGTGREGERAATETCGMLAALAGCRPQQVLPFSTGVIGESLPVTPFRRALPGLLGELAEDRWAEAATGILTTDTRPKGASRSLEVDGRTVTLTGIAKGAGMIRPDMATMLAFIATDAAFEPGLARRLLREAVAGSFNRITVDGDTSTNDACALAATGASGARLRSDSPELAAYRDALQGLCGDLARAIVRDGEGATRMVSIGVTGAASEAEAERVGFTVAESPLVKTAVFAGDPNWGRILAAVGRAGIDDLDVERVRIHLDDYLIAEHGGRAATYEEHEAATRMAGEEVTIGIDLGRGAAAATVWTCDLSYEYVRINAEYRS
ncbi:bifunctional glutamate N-acetyltransferase/amino-acid acetyltransferase ArgJ [Sediminicurvatus halobius]|uniref:Arginine biosynthesis bifunctional protein ArgJ n=1 Tax=Sediminicurvatus halobius TaxID=2182432 RepID=A0A2U2N7K3_9GAMM|nr:bifunctional glutamate N-acetyltransferase/amino-acid acetyltransferase ArgJ [Spiribacter halobius]PWG65165.1 bifunctional ornithine acetyltransferase/N-acetylglutamate synthase [Spiribacter halobius]UEX78884.1 bifunctional glutamate N-acetyltransferase/amino-acid acetyltransferase ArgJ [Spiribacter halobius]